MKSMERALLYLSIIAFMVLANRHSIIPYSGTLVCGTPYTEELLIIDKNTSFKASASPIILDRYTLILKGAVLTIEPGVTVKVGNHVGIICYGIIKAEGTSTTPINITGVKEGQAPWTGAWANIILGGTTASKSTFKHCIISGSGGLHYPPYPPGFHPQDPIEIRPIGMNPEVDFVYGGAIVCCNASPLIENCTFSSNRTKVHGGAILLMHGANAIITGNRFVDNYAGLSGGAIMARDSAPAIENNLFENNKSGKSGGAIQLLDTSGLTLKNNVFKNNSVENGLGGAVFAAIKGSLRVSNNTFSTSRADAGGAFMGMFVNMHMDHCNFIKNNADLSGGGLYLSEATAILEKCGFSQNSASSGGAIYGITSGLKTTDCSFSVNVPNNVEFSYSASSGASSGTSN